jgi:glucoamylase
MNLIRSFVSFAMIALVPMTIAKAWKPAQRPDEAQVAFSRLLKNISPSDAMPGAVVAAQTRQNPNYYYHWVRDAALVMDALVSVYSQSTDENQKSLIRQKLYEYAAFSDHIQQLQTLTNLGEPKFYVDGSVYSEPWGRPQNDSPALRALSLIHWAKILEVEGQDSYVRAKLYDGKIPANSVIKRDLEYVAHHWQEPSFDLWEEVLGDHFYTRMVQRRALLEGAELARILGDSGASVYYQLQARAIEKDLLTFWNANLGYIVATRNRVGGLDYKAANLDTAVILALLHGGMNDGFLSFSDSRVLLTLQKMEGTFRQLYRINRTRSMAPAIGRYPEDRYGGSNFNGGNPWPLCTLALAEAYYKAAAELTKKGNIPKAKELINRGDEFVARVTYHQNADGSLNEQIDRNTGYMTSVADLTWNYAAFLTTSMARSAAAKATK